MTDSQGAAKAAPKTNDVQDAEQDISWIGARLREPSTYAGLGTLAGVATLFHLLPDAGSGTDLVKDITMIGMGLGGLIAIVLPEGKSKRAPAPGPQISTAALVLFTIGAVLALTLPSARAQGAGTGIGTADGSPYPIAAAASSSAPRVLHRSTHRAASSSSVPLPAARAAQLPAAAIYDQAAAAKPTVNEAQSNPLVVLQQFTVSDLQAALKDAQAQTPPDTTAAACYAALIPFVQSQAQNPLPAGAGVFQALQKARDAKAYLANIQSPTGPLAGLNQACAPLVLDVQNTLLTLGVSVGVIANPAAATATLAGLPAAVASFLALPKLPLP